MTDIEQRDFKGVWIPKAVWLDKRLNAIDKIILAEIDSLDMDERGCFASNKYIADFCQCSERKVSQSVSKLIEYNYLYVKSFDGRTRELKSRLSCIDFFAGQPRKICEADTKNLRHNNTVNKTDNNTEIKKERKTGSFDEIIFAYSQDEKTVDLLREWLKVRKAKRAAMTDRAVKMNIEKLDSLAAESGMSVNDYLGEVICRGWAAFYAIKTYGNTNNSASSAEERRTVNGKDYIFRNGKYYIPNGSGIPVDPYADDMLPY